jgi:hypothetical protein
MTVYYPDEATAGDATIGVGIALSNVSEFPARHGIPGAIRRDDLFFWTRAWQEGERESAEARAAGGTREFASGHDAVRWLLSSDDDE